MGSKIGVGIGLCNVQIYVRLCNVLKNIKSQGSDNKHDQIEAIELMPEMCNRITRLQRHIGDFFQAAEL